MSRNEKTSPRVATLAAKLLAMSHYDLDVWINANPEGARRVIRIRTLCGSLVTQASDKSFGDRHPPPLKYKRGKGKR